MPIGHPAVSPTYAHPANVGSPIGKWIPYLRPNTRQSLDGRAYFLEDIEQIWANPSVRFPLPQNLVHVLTYLRALMASKSIAYWRILVSKITRPSGWDDPIVPR
jgi:hypothetical protein